jgi:prophage regulatory protein
MVAAMDAFLDRHAVERITTLSYPTLWRMMRKGEFPRPIALSANRVGWSTEAVNEWMAKKLQTGAAGKVA